MLSPSFEVSGSQAPQPPHTDQVTQINSSSVSEQIELGGKHLTGTDYKPKEAFACFKKATELDNNHAEAWYNLAYCYQEGVGTEHNPSKAFECLKLATEKNDRHTEAWNNLGYCYLNGVPGTKCNPDEAFNCFKKASEADPQDAQAWNNLAYCYQEGVGTQRNSREASICQAHVKMNNKPPEDLDYLGPFYQKHYIDTQRNPSETFRYFKKDTDKVSQEAETWNGLGYCYLNSIGTKRNPDEAFVSFKKATEIDSQCTGAWNNLGYCYLYGLGTDRNPNEAFKCFKKATEGNSNLAAAAWNLASCYRNGIGTEYNAKKALKYKNRAINFAKYSLVNIFLKSLLQNWRLISGVAVGIALFYFTGGTSLLMNLFLFMGIGAVNAATVTAIASLAVGMAFVAACKAAYSGLQKCFDFKKEIKSDSKVLEANTPPVPLSENSPAPILLSSSSLRSDLQQSPAALPKKVVSNSLGGIRMA